MFDYKEDQFLGGTELMGKRFDKDILPKFPNFKEHHWIMVPGTFPDNDIRKSFIVWNHLHASSSDYRWMNDPSIKNILFVSNYQQQSFVSYYGIDQKKSFVINNYIPNIVPKEKNGKIKIVFQSSLNRGLSVLLKAIKQIDYDLEVHIFGDISGSDSEIFNRHLVKSINDYCEKDKRIVKHGRVSNEKLIEEISGMHMFVYPSIIEEVSCISLMEAMAAGLYCIHSNIGALPETSMGLTDSYVFVNDEEYHAKIIAEKIMIGIEKIKSGWSGDEQSKIANRVYSLENTLEKWKNFYDKVERSTNYV